MVLAGGQAMLICTFIATRLGHNRNAWHGYGVGVFLFAMVVFNLTKLPYNLVLGTNVYRVSAIIVR